MKKPLLVLVVLLCLAVPTALAAPPAGHQDAESAAEKACRAEQGTTAQSKAAFADRYGTNKNKKNAFGKCVSSKSKGEDDEDEADEDKGEKQDKMNASKKCKAERGTTAASIAAFAEKYGTNKNKKNAFGKCVSKAAKQKAKTS